MPRIKNINYWVGREKMTATINYSSKDNEFYLYLPEEMSDVAKLFIDKKNEAIEKGRAFYGVSVTSPCKLHSGSQAGLESLLKEYVEFYEIVKTQKRRVIVADFEYKSDDIHWSRGGQYSDGGYSFIRFKYWICTEYNNNGRIDYIDEANGHRLSEASRRPDYFKIIPYTEDAEEFMKNFYIAMNQLMSKIGKYCGSSQSLIDTISKGLKMIDSKSSVK